MKKPSMGFLVLYLLLLTVISVYGTSVPLCHSKIQGPEPNSRVIWKNNRLEKRNTIPFYPILPEVLKRHSQKPPLLLLMKNSVMDKPSHHSQSTNVLTDLEGFFTDIRSIMKQLQRHRFRHDNENSPLQTVTGRISTLYRNLLRSKYMNYN